MNREKGVTLPDAGVLAGLSLVSIGLFIALGIAASDQAIDALVLAIRLYVMASNTVLGVLDHNLGQLILTVAAAWALMAGAGVWILWRMTHPAPRAAHSHEVTHGS